MSIFGQVWLWSLLAFFVGVLLTWLVLVLPLRKAFRRLENELERTRADAARTPANQAALASATQVFSPVEQPATVIDQEPAWAASRISPDSPAPLALPATTDSYGSYGLHEEQEQHAGEDVEHDDFQEAYGDLSGVEDEQDVQSLLEPAEPELDHVDEAFEALRGVDPAPDAAEPPYHPGATQYLGAVTAPVPAQEDPYRAAATEYLRPADEEEPEPAGSLFETEPATSELPQRSRLEEQLDPAPGALFQPSREEHPPAPDWFDHEPLPVRSPFEEPLDRTEYIGAVTPPASSSAEPEEDDESDIGGVLDDVPEESPAEMTQVLPKRQPRESPRGGFEPPQPIEPSIRAVERRDPDLTGGYSGSLFEPSVQPNQVAAAMPAPPEAPPARHSHPDSVPPGPFGPGSAMPRPGGGSPGEDFSVKASVTALRYCTDESASFPRMVAEVWFRTAEDAERVGFRPLT